MPKHGKYSRASVVCTNRPKKDSNKCFMNSRCDNIGNSCHMPTCANDFGAIPIFINPPKKDSNSCCLDLHCIGSRNNCHMPTYAKNSKASYRLGNSSRIKQNNGIKLNNNNSSSHSGCLVHCGIGIEPMKEKIESNLCCRQFQSASNEPTNRLNDANLGHILLHEKKHNNPSRHSKKVNKFSMGDLDEISILDTFSEVEDHRNVCMMHDDINGPSMKGKEIEVGNKGHEEIVEQHHSLNKRMDLNVPEKNLYRSFQQCSQVGVVKNQSTLTATKDIEKETAFVVSDKFSIPLFNL